jgi:hypothetical protein
MSKNNIITYLVVKNIVEKRGGKLITDENNYINGMSEINVQCERGHIWKVDGGHIKAGNWCPFCNKKSFNEIKSFIENKRGVILISENEFKTVTTPFPVKCKYGHIWYPMWTNLSKGKWCSVCNGGVKLKLGDAQRAAEKRGGKCLSTEYKNINEPMLWECVNGHTWTTTFACIKIGTWCTKCRAFTSEEICRQYFEQLFNMPFPKCRPKFLKNERTGYKLELDGFCKELGIAFEHHGQQHFRQKTSFSDSKESFEKRLEYDKLKIKLCKENNIKLIIIPQLHILTSLEGLKDFIKGKCKELEIILPEHFNEQAISINYKELYPSIQLILNKYINIVNSKGGKYISGNYINNRSKVKCECKNGHIFEIRCDNLLTGKWCKECHLNSRVKMFSYELLNNLYNVKKLNMTEIAKQLNTNIEKISNLLNFYNLRQQTRFIKSKENDEKNRNDLYKLYIIENKTVSEIGRIYSKSHKWAIRILKRLGLYNESRQ